MLSDWTIHEAYNDVQRLAETIGEILRSATSDDWKDRYVEEMSLFSDVAECLKKHVIEPQKPGE